MTLNPPAAMNFRDRSTLFDLDNSFNNGWGVRNGRLNYASPVFNAAAFSDSYSFNNKANQSYEDINPVLFPQKNSFSPHNYSSTMDQRRFMTPHLPIHKISPDTSVKSSPLDLSFSRLILDDSVDSSGYSDSSRPAVRTTLPAESMNNQGQIAWTFAEILQKGMIMNFARDKLGCHFLQENYPCDDKDLREELVKQVLASDENFDNLCSDVFGNFFIQCIIENSNVTEQRWISSRLTNNMFTLCLNRYSCRVVQTAIEHLNIDVKGVLLLELHEANLVKLSIDQNANHVIQKIMNMFPLTHWSFIVEKFVKDVKSLFDVAENKYGCRVIQLSIELLAKCKQKGSHNAENLLKGMMDHLISHCERLASNEFANYVIQHVIESQPLARFRDQIIEKCLLRNLLSMSQEKYASHVVEKALGCAPPHLLKEMMDEIFEGYVPHPETKRDALDIMIFHQYGNYVIQRMLDICVAAAKAEKNGEHLPDMSFRKAWLRRLEERIITNKGRLSKYSSGKKILETLEKIPGYSSGQPTYRSHNPSAPKVPQGYR